MEWRILLAFVLLAILLASVLSIAYVATPAVRNRLDDKKVKYNLLHAKANANVNEVTDDPYDVNLGWNGLYRHNFHFFDSSGNFI